MKFKGVDRAIDKAESRPARGAWVEICIRAMAILLPSSRAPQGARGLKCLSP